MFYYIWISSIIATSILAAYLSYMNNIYGGKWFFLITILNILPIWAFVSRYSKNLIFDSLLYDIILFVTYSVSIGIFSNSFVSFNCAQIIGFLIILIGFILLQIK